MRLLWLLVVLLSAALTGCAPFAGLDAVNDQFEHHHHR